MSMVKNRSNHLHNDAVYGENAPSHVNQVTFEHHRHRNHKMPHGGWDAISDSPKLRVNFYGEAVTRAPPGEQGYMILGRPDGRQSRTVTSGTAFNEMNILGPNVVGTMSEMIAVLGQFSAQYIPFAPNLTAGTFANIPTSGGPGVEALDAPTNVAAFTGGKIQHTLRNLGTSPVNCEIYFLVAKMSGGSGAQADTVSTTTGREEYSTNAGRSGQSALPGKYNPSTGYTTTSIFSGTMSGTCAAPAAAASNISGNTKGAIAVLTPGWNVFRANPTDVIRLIQLGYDRKTSNLGASAAVNSTTFLRPHMDPGYSGDFKSWWRVERKHIKVLDPGAIHNIVVDLDWKYMFNTFYSTKEEMTKNRCFTIMLRFWGVPVTGVDTHLLTGTSVIDPAMTSAGPTATATGSGFATSTATVITPSLNPSDTATGSGTAVYMSACTIGICSNYSMTLRTPMNADSIRGIFVPDPTGQFQEKDPNANYEFTIDSSGRPYPERSTDRLGTSGMAGEVLM